MTVQVTHALPQTQAPFDSQPEVGSDPVVPSPGGAAGSQQKEQPKAQKQKQKAAEPPAKQARFWTHPESLRMELETAQPGDGDWQAPRPPGGAGLAAVDEEAGEEVRCTLTCALHHHAQSLTQAACVLPCLLRRRPQLQRRASARARPRRRRRSVTWQLLQRLRHRRRQRKPRLHLHQRRVSPPRPTWRLTCRGAPCGAASRRGRSRQWPLLPPRLRPRRR